MALITIVTMVLILNLLFFFGFLYLLHWVVIHICIFITFSLISFVSLLLTLLYYLHCSSKLLIITWFIIKKKIDKFKIYKVAAPSAVAVVAFISKTFSSILVFLPLLTWLYHLYCSCKLLKIMWCIIEKRTDEFKTSGVPVAVAIAVVAFVSRTF